MLPASPQPSALQLTSVFWMQWDRGQPLGKQPTWLGKVDLHSHTLTFPHWRNRRLKGSPWHWAVSPSCVTREQRMTWVKWNCSYPFNVSILGLFCSNNVLQLFHWTPRSLQRYPCPWVIVKFDVLWGKWCRKLLSHHLADVTCFHYTFVYVWNFPNFKLKYACVSLSQ